MLIGLSVHCDQGTDFPKQEISVFSLEIQLSQNCEKRKKNKKMVYLISQRVYTIVQFVHNATYNLCGKN